MTDKARQKQTTAAGAVQLEESKLDAISAGGDLPIILKIPPGDTAGGSAQFNPKELPISVPVPWKKTGQNP